MPKLSDSFMQKSNYPTQGQGLGVDSCDAVVLPGWYKTPHASQAGMDACRE